MSGTSTTQVTGSGGIRMGFNFTRLDPYSFYTGLGAQTSLTFLDGTDALSVGGLLKMGTQKTSGDVALTLNIAAQSGSPQINLVSGNGSCEITVDTATADSIAGSFRCDHVKAAKGLFLNIEGAFSGTMPGAGG